MQSGFVLLWREMLEKELFREKPFCNFAAWVWLIMEANWEDKPDRFGDVVKRGELHTSQPALADEFGWTRAKVRRFLDRLQAEQRISQQTTKIRTKIIIVNYEQYQSIASTFQKQPAKQPARKPAKQPAITELSTTKELSTVRTGDERHAYGENNLVFLTDAEFSRLSERHTPERTMLALKIVDAWINKKPGKLRWFEKNYSSAFAVINPSDSWVWERVDAASSKPAPRDFMERKAARQADVVERAQALRDAQERLISARPKLEAK